MTQLNEVKLTMAQEKQWEMTRSSLLWNCAGFTHILYEMMTPDGKDSAYWTTDVPIAATDGSRLLLNPDKFFSYTLNERVFIIVHEIMHCILDHMGQMHHFTRTGKVNFSNGKSLPYDPKLMNVATDLVINDMLISSKIGQFNKDWLHDPKIATGNDSAIDAYAKVFKQDKNGGGGQGQGFDQHLPPGAASGKDPTVAQQQRSPSEWNTAVAAARDSMKARGQLHGDLERFFNDMLTPKVSWTEYIQGFFARKVGSGGYDWRRPDRRLIVRDIYAPARSGFGAGVVAVAIDTSGSIGQTELDTFFAEMRGILEDVRPRLIKIIWCDAQVHGVDDIEDTADFHGVKPKGGGGTAFEPVFNYLAEQQIEPDALVYLTDGMGSFPDRPPSYPVIWGSIYPQSKYPWGEVVNIPLKDAA
jgi:predicted metal-dependent peptidase